MQSLKKFLSPSYIDSVFLDLLYDEEQAAVIPELVETSDSEATHYEKILWTPSCTDHILLLLLYNYAKA